MIIIIMTQTHLNSQSAICKVLPYVVLDFLRPHSVQPLLHKSLDAMLPLFRGVDADEASHILSDQAGVREGIVAGWGWKIGRSSVAVNETTCGCVVAVITT